MPHQVSVFAENKPGKIERVTTILADNNINIRAMTLSDAGDYGIIKLLLNNPEKGIVDTYFSLFTLKYYYPVQPDEHFPGFEAMDGIEITKTDKTSTICGFNCKNAKVTFPADRNKTYEIWYTYDINVKNPNAATPFEKIDGVLMSFFFILGPIELHLDAENVYRKEIPDKAFERREKFARVSKEEIDKFINKMISL